AGAAASLARPIRGARLHLAILKALGHAAHRSGVDGDSPSTVSPGPHPPLRILVVEDNSINQKVAQLMLGRLGYRADLAGNGLEALEALRRQPYDLALMDVQMPEMDGLEATRRIRAEPSAPQDLRIVAMTAHASRESRDECLASGMDDFLSKPLAIEDLARVLRRAAGVEAPSGPLPEPVDAGLPPFDPLPLLNLRRLEELAKGAIVDDLVEKFLYESQQSLARMRQAAGREDAAALAALAHSLRGSSGLLGARRITELSAGLEELGRQGTFDGAATLLDLLAAELARIEPLLRAELAQT
ncbi:MAG: response regulator, partial [Thermoanaerobaculia bacterium]